MIPQRRAKSNLRAVEPRRRFYYTPVFEKAQERPEKPVIKTLQIGCKIR
jgi:hypothetical protein